ncbi:MAG: hypothetical protein AB1744_10865, partial [Candidatus Zixiibacteriota bacterium]
YVLQDADDRFWIAIHSRTERGGVGSGSVSLVGMLPDGFKEIFAITGATHFTKGKDAYSTALALDDRQTSVIAIAEGTYQGRTVEERRVIALPR